jgi:hypothetical protein
VNLPRTERARVALQARETVITDQAKKLLLKERQIYANLASEGDCYRSRETRSRKAEKLLGKGNRNRDRSRSSSAPQVLLAPPGVGGIGNLFRRRLHSAFCTLHSAHSAHSALDLTCCPPLAYAHASELSLDYSKVPDSSPRIRTRRSPLPLLHPSVLTRVTNFDAARGDTDTSTTRPPTSILALHGLAESGLLRFFCRDLLASVHLPSTVSICSKLRPSATAQ